MSIHTHTALALMGAALIAGCSSAPPPPPAKPFAVVVIGPRGELVTSPTVKVYGYVEGGEASVVKVGDATAQLGLGGSFEATVPSGPDGLQTRMVEARARAGGSPAKAEVAWTTDNTDPKVTITAPADPAVAVTRDALRVEGTVADVSPVLITVDERSVPLDGNRFEFTKMLAEGVNTVSLVATDAAGHATTVTLTLRKDTQPPVCELVPVPGTVRTRSFTVRGSTGEDGCRVFVNGEEATVTGMAFSHEILLEAGTNAFDVVVRDAAGHQATASGSVDFEPRELPTKDELRARLEQELTATGGGWYTGQYADLEAFGQDVWQPLLQLAEELSTATDQRTARLAIQAMEALAQLHVRDAVPFFQRLADTQPQGLGETAIWLLDRLDDPERAQKRLESMRRDIENDPAQGPRVWGEIGDAHARMNHYEESRQAYLKAIEAARVLGQTNTTQVRSVWYNLACQHCKLGDVDAGLDAFDECQKIDGSDLDWAAKDGDLKPLRARERFLRYFWETGTGPQLATRAMDIASSHPESGLKILERGRDRLSRDPNLLVFLALLYQQNGREDDATKTLDYVASEIPSLPWANIGKLPPLQPLRANARFRELTGAPEPGAGPTTPPGPGGETPGGTGPGTPTPAQPGPAASPAGVMSEAAVQAFAQQRPTPGRILLPNDLKIGSYVQWSFANGMKMWWGVTDEIGNGIRLVEQRVQLPQGWVVVCHVVAPDGTVQQAIALAFNPATGRGTGKSARVQTSQQVMRSPSSDAVIGEGAETVTAAGREFQCRVVSGDSNGRAMKQWVSPDVPFNGLVKVEIDGRQVLTLEAIGTDAKPAVQLKRQPGNGKPKDGQGDF